MFKFISSIKCISFVIFKFQAVVLCYFYEICYDFENVNSMILFSMLLFVSLRQSLSLRKATNMKDIKIHLIFLVLAKSSV